MIIAIIADFVWKLFDIKKQSELVNILIFIEICIEICGVLHLYWLFLGGR